MLEKNSRLAICGNSEPEKAVIVLMNRIVSKILMMVMIKVTG